MIDHAYKYVVHKYNKYFSNRNSVRANIDNTNTEPTIVDDGKFSDNRKRLNRSKRAATARSERVWDYAVIPYEIDANFSGVHKALFKQESLLNYPLNLVCHHF